MRCKHCQKEIDVLATTCPSCGCSQSILDEPHLPDSSDDLLGRVSRSIETDLAAAYNTINAGSSLVSGDNLNQSTGASWRLGQLRTKAKAGFFYSLYEYLETPVEEIQQMAQFVFYSSHVQSNLLYRERAAQTTLHYLPEEDMVNAFATDTKISEFSADPPMICIMGGLTRVTQLVANALAENDETGTVNSREKLVDMIQQIGGQVVEGQGYLSSDAARDIMANIDETNSVRKTKSYNAAMNMTVIAHELGHIALGHTLANNRISLEISRNQEREADSFAASVASSSPFGDYIVAGGIFFWIIMAWIDAAGGDLSQNSHPDAKERLMDYIRANRGQAEDIGFDAGGIGAFLP